MTPTPVSDQAQMMDPTWLYDEIMQHIEPDLLTKNLPTLDTKYAGESEEKREQRFQRYDLAFELYNETLDDVMEEEDAENAFYLTQLRVFQSEDNAVEESDVIKSIEDSINDISDDDAHA